MSSYARSVLAAGRRFIRQRTRRRAGCYLWTLRRRSGSFLWTVQRTDAMTDAKKSEVLQGTLDLMILKTLHALGPQHGFGIARRIEQVSRDVLQLNDGTVYTSLLRLQQQGWIAAQWGTSENNRRAKFYSITARGEKQLAVETENWERISGVVGRVLRLEEERQPWLPGGFPPYVRLRREYVDFSDI